MSNVALNRYSSVVAADLVDTEDTIDQSLAKAGILLTSMASGRLEAGLPAQVGHHALTHLADAIQAGVVYRGHMVALHRSLEAAGRKMGADWSMGGPLESKPEDGSQHTVRGQLVAE